MKHEQGLWKLACAALAVLSMAWSAGCDEGGGGAVSGDGSSKGSPDTARVVKLAFVTSGSGEFWKSAIAGVTKYEQEAKIRVDVMMPQNSTPEENVVELKARLVEPKK